MSESHFFVGAVPMFGAPAVWLSGAGSVGRVAAGGWLFVLGWMGRGVVIRRSIRLFACLTVHSFIRRLLGLVPVLSGALLIGVVGVSMNVSTRASAKASTKASTKALTKNLNEKLNRNLNLKTEPLTTIISEETIGAEISFVKTFSFSAIFMRRSVYKLDF
ncbi:hypothetical protein PMI08_03450 [Brevibacillus sp. CF112]|nr:hypothetical protein PMI08_03450 [Brevibacillus sp. CF112]